MDRSLFNDDIRGARPKFLYPTKNRQFPYSDAYSSNLQNVQYGRNLYQSQMLSLPEQIAPQGLGYFRADGKKHFPEQQRGEIDQYRGLQNVFDPPNRYAADYDRSLLTKDIEGAVTNTLISKVVKNKELASVYQRDLAKQHSVYEPNTNTIDTNQDYQSRKNQLDSEFYKNKSFVNITNKVQQDRIQEQQIQTSEETDRQRKQQLMMEQQWEQQRQEAMLRQQQVEQEREQEYQKQQFLKEKAAQAFEEQKYQEEIKKQKYADDLKQQVQLLHRSQQQTPPAPLIPKSHQINQLLQYPRSSQGVQQKEALDSLMEERRMIGINRYQPHELQQYMYDVKNGKINQGLKTRNTPTFMSYAGQVAVEQNK